MVRSSKKTQLNVFHVINLPLTSPGLSTYKRTPWPVNSLTKPPDNRTTPPIKIHLSTKPSLFKNVYCLIKVSKRENLKCGLDTLSKKRSQTVRGVPCLKNRRINSDNLVKTQTSLLGKAKKWSVRHYGH